MERKAPVIDRQLDRQGRRLARPGGWWLTVALLVALPGAVMTAIGVIVTNDNWVFTIGVAILALAGCPLIVGLALLSGGAITRWSARHRPFA